MQTRPLSLPFLALLLSLLISLATAASSLPSFCKCIVGANYTIINLNNARAPSGADQSTWQGALRTCNDCNRQFCLEYNLPFAKGIKEEDMTTQCFQRDSYKDRAVVYTFIILTVGLLVYAALRPYVDAQIEFFKERRSYAPIGSSQ